MGSETERVRCGASHPDARVDADLQDMRDEIGAPQDTAGCGGNAIWTYMYRCVECARWFHRDCIRRHFAAHQGADGDEDLEPDAHCDECGKPLRAAADYVLDEDDNRLCLECASPSGRGDPQEGAK